MAPIITPLPASAPEVTESAKVKVKAAAAATEATETPLNDVYEKPLPELIEKVLEVIKQEEDRLRVEEELMHAVNQVRFDKPLAPVEYSNLSAPPSPPPKDDQTKERLSLEEDYSNCTVDLKDITNTEYRERTNSMSHQWYFDEYSGIYRQNAPGLWGFQSMPSLQQYTAPSTRTSDTHIKHITEKLLSSHSSILDASQSPSLRLRFSQRHGSRSNRSSVATSSGSSGIMTSSTMDTPELGEQQQVDAWPSPRTVEQVHQLRKQARATRDRRKQLDLCRTLMDAACRDEETEHVTESPIPGTPPVNTRYRQQELRRLKKKDLMLDQVLVLEAQKILKRLALGGGGMGLGTDGDAQFLLANCYGVGGLGLPLDRERAFSLYIHASKQNHIESTYRAGVCYEIGIGTRKDYGRAMSFYRKAATQSHVASMYKLAIILMRGYCGQTINMKEALTWLQRAAALANTQNPHAMYALAMFQFSEEFAEHTIADSSYALELLHTSAHMEYLPSQVKLGELYEMGGHDLVQVDDALSIYWYTRAAEQGNADAALALSSWYLTGSTGILAQSDREAYLWARKAASCQLAERWTIAKAYFLVGMYVKHKIGVSETSTEDAAVWFERSAALGHLGAMAMFEKQEEDELDDDI
ncbi:HCP-like protein [Mucor ambiguus]|uniref:HCP-like protein n=1 Tax=Mucor ambiguus TaxID=91626 RepID=A0A0C9LX58_9FUNG|nr:HCP-like protein [Mucor ambiguus]